MTEMLFDKIITVQPYFNDIGKQLARLDQEIIEVKVTIVGINQNILTNAQEIAKINNLMTEAQHRIAGI